MNVPGFAYTNGENAEIDRRKAIIDYLDELEFGKFVKITKSSVEYAKHVYYGKVDLSFEHSFNPEDLLFWLDGRPLAPFGGTISYNQLTGDFSATVYTD